MKDSEGLDEGFGGAGRRTQRSGMKDSEGRDGGFGGAGRAGRHDTMVHLVPGDADERSPA